jgi:cell division septum initiation protein DivIVA
VERRVEEEVRARIAAAGADRARWPAEAVAEVGRLETKVGAVSSMASTLEEQLAAESKSRAGDARHAALLRQRVNELEAGAIRGERESADRMRALERDLRAARDEAEECRRIVSEVEEERETLRQQMQPQKV